MIRISQLKLKIPHTEEELEAEIIRRAYGQKPVKWRIVRRSIDARKKPELYYIYTIDAAFAHEKKVLHHRNSKWSESREVKYRFPFRVEKTCGGRRLREEERPVVIGSGPAGLFAALMLARGGFAPVLFERGDAVDLRSEKVERFFLDGVLDEESNVQFGEGGAGTFSDGKLNTVVKDKSGRNRFVLEEFVRHGAPEEILYEAKPHIGTDILKNVVASIREEILSLGGEVHFRTKLVGLMTEDDGTGERHLTGIRLETETGTGEEKKGTVPCQTYRSVGRMTAGRDTCEIERVCRTVILAIGHSARDTFSMLYEQRVQMTPKSFAIGVRVEHPAEMINRSQYGERYPEGLPTASYKLTHQCANGRGIYSFCMCPGGYVVNASSEPGRLAVNGMSYHDRDSQNANSALIVTVTPEDFQGEGPLAGVEFQRRLEEKAYKLGNGKIPLQLYGDYLRNQKSTSLGQVTPCMKGGWNFGNLRELFPEQINETLTEGIQAFGNIIPGFDRKDMVLSGVESRTSSPVRITRDESFQCNITGIYPCGEGAGYAGGITSAAMDGLKVGEAIVKKIRNLF